MNKTLGDMLLHGSNHVMQGDIIVSPGKKTPEM